MGHGHYVIRGGVEGRERLRILVASTTRSLLEVDAIVRELYAFAEDSRAVVSIPRGSAVRGSRADLKACGAAPVVIGTLAVLGQSAARLAAVENVALETIAALPNEIWTPLNCPLCARGVPLDDALQS